MFKVGNLKINFRHEYFHVSETTGKPCYEGTGRFGVSCFIYQEGVEEAIAVGSVLIHKGDQPDRVIGKKYALRKALRVAYVWNDNKQITCTWLFPKQKRTEIWDAFWEWVESWKPKKRIEFVGYIDSYNPQITSNTRSLDLEIKCTHPTTNEICSDMVQVLGKNMKITMEEI